MSGQLIEMGPAEFLKKVLSGERYFSGIKLSSPEGRRDLSRYGAFAEMQDYLIRNEKDLKSNPLNLSGSDLRYLMANGLHIPYTIALKTDFEGANFGDGACLQESLLTGASFIDANLPHALLNSANLSESSFRNAGLYGADLRNSMLSGADFSWAKLWNADLRNTNVGDTNFEHAYLRDADLRDARNLRSAKLERALAYRVKLSPGEEELAKRLNGGEPAAPFMIITT